MAISTADQATQDSENSTSNTIELHMLTTTDNPYNPFTHFDEWLMFDTQAGYFTSNFLARIVKTSDALSDTDQDLALEQAIDEIVNENSLGIYRKISKDTNPVTSNAPTS